MAREAGMEVVDDQFSLLPFLERFFHMAQAAEREACAKVCDDIRNDWKTHGDEMKTYAAEYLANAIRVRGQA